MDPKTPDRTLFAPPASSGGALRLPGSGDPRPPDSRTQARPRGALPRVDEHLVQSETREELVRGRRAVAMPALPPHGDQHFRLDYVLGASVKRGYVGSAALLTRLTESSNFATDTCVRRAGTDPRTNARYLEELAFEVVNEQSLKDITERAEDLTTRGVRRVLAIFVKIHEVSEWSAAAHAWRALDPEDAIDDPCLEHPIPVRALLDAATADDAVARALVEKNNPVIAALRSEERSEGREEGLREGRLALLASVARRFERRIGRALTGAERATLDDRLDDLGEDRLEDARDALTGESLAAWLADPAAT